jgi:hypothetical protein
MPFVATRKTRAPSVGNHSNKITTHGSAVTAEDELEGGHGVVRHFDVCFVGFLKRFRRKGEKEM